MKKNSIFMSLVVLVVALLASCSDAYKGVDNNIADLVETRLVNVKQERASEIKKAIAQSPDAEREGLAFLFAYMPQYDLDTLSITTIVKNVEYAYKARNTYSWAKEIPLDVFYNDVLPYTSMDETRENWRESFYKMLEPIVANVKDARAAVDTINKAITDLVGVTYNTKRKKSNQSPSESMTIGMASCSGLSILLTDALRAVGIPSRLAGAPMWVTKEGNHTWSEVWLNGEWYFLEYSIPVLNDGWFLYRCAAFEGQTNPVHQVYATSFAPKGDTHFLMSWAFNDKSINGINVTQFYVDLYKKQTAEKMKNDETMTATAIKVFKNGGNVQNSGDRVELDIAIFDKDGKEVAKGKSRGVSADMNDYLVVYLPKNSTYKIVYGDKKQTINSGSDASQEFVLYY